MALTVNDIYMEVRRALKRADISMPELEARELTAFVCGADKKRHADWGYRYLDDETVARARALTERRLNGEPLAYLIGEWDFYGLTFLVTPDVLIPRSDTEPLCEQAIARAQAIVCPRVLDLCCGSGCIGVALLHAVDDARVFAADVSEAALTVARENARRLGVSGRFFGVRADALGQPPEQLQGFHMMVCNPPYITGPEMAALDRSVADYEPHLALYGGADGLDFYRAIAAHWTGVMLPGGTMFFECGWKQAAQVASLFEEAGFMDIVIEEDYAGVRRVVVVRIPGDEQVFDSRLQNPRG